jgi:hypothetical protein
MIQKYFWSPNHNRIAVTPSFANCHFCFFLPLLLMQPEMYLVFSGYRVIVEWQDYLFGFIVSWLSSRNQKSSVNPDCTRIRIILIYRSGFFKWREDLWLTPFSSGVLANHPEKYRHIVKDYWRFPRTQLEIEHFVPNLEECLKKSDNFTLGIVSPNSWSSLSWPTEPKPLTSILPRSTRTVRTNSTNKHIVLRMQEMAFQGFKFQNLSGGECPRTPGVVHPLWKTSSPSNKSGQIRPWYNYTRPWKDAMRAWIG